MKAILTSSLGGQVKIDGKRLPAKYMVEQIINVRENDNTGYGN